MGILGQRESKAAIVNECAVDKPHRDNKADGSQYTNGGKVLHRVHIVLFQNSESRCIGKRNSRHKESHAQRIESDEQRLVSQLLSEACLTTQPPATEHKEARHQMAEA